MLEQERYAVVSCHVERLLDTRTWQLFSQLQEQIPSGFQIAALLRPPDEIAGEPIEPWLERAREASEWGPLGHHTHWGGPTTARPRSGDPHERVRREGAWLQSVGLRPTIFCGGGWYIDPDVATVVAELGYVDCTATAFRPTYLDVQEPRLNMSGPGWLELPSGRRLLEIPTTHALSMLARGLLLSRNLDRPVVHFYFHDTDLLNRVRAVAVRSLLALLARRRVPTHLDQVARKAHSQDLPVQQLRSTGDMKPLC
jgi:hypothetical protein